jgi:hypothetical protein
VDVEIELACVMSAPPVLEVAAVSLWVARLQSLLAEVRRAKVREARKRLRG